MLLGRCRTCIGIIGVGVWFDRYSEIPHPKLSKSTLYILSNHGSPPQSRLTSTVYISDLFEAFGVDSSLYVIGANCLDKYKQYYDWDYIAKHRPILLLKFDDSLPDDWPHTEQGNTLGPYCVVHESSYPSEPIYGS